MNAAAPGSVARHSELLPYRQIFLHAYTVRRDAGSRWLERFLLFITLVPAPLIFLFGHNLPLACTVALTFVGALCGLWWTRFIGSVGDQMALQARYRVPRLRGCLMRATLLLWSAMCVLMASIFALGFGDFALAAAVTGLVLLGFSLANQQPMTWIVCVCLFSSKGCMDPAMRLPLEAAVAEHRLLVCIVLLLALGSWAWRKMFVPVPIPPASVRNRPWWLGGDVNLALGQPRAASKVYLWQMRRDIARPRRLGALLGHGFGPGWHWSSRLSCLALPALALLPVCREYYLYFGTVLMAAYCLSAVADLPRRFGASRKEQSLVRLAPGMPAGRGLNRLLGRQLLLGYAQNWAITAAAVLLFGLCSGADAAGLFTLLGLCLLLLAPAGLVLNDYAAASAPRLWWQVALAAMLLLALLGAGAGWPAALPLLAGTWLLAAAACLAWRWRNMLAALPSLPAGRATGAPRAG